MKHQVVACFDIKARTFAAPFTVGHLDIARRAFGEVANMADHQVGKHPEDFILFHLGTFDDETGRFESLQQPDHLGTGLNYKKGPLS